MDAWTIIDLITEINEDTLHQPLVNALLDALQRHGARRMQAELERAAPIVPAAWEYERLAIEANKALATRHLPTSDKPDFAAKPASDALARALSQGSR